MSWYAVHVVLYLRFTDGVQDKHYVQENVVLVDGSSRDEVLEKAAAKARDEYATSPDGSLACDGRPAWWEFVGVRKYINCEDVESPPKSGSELTYLHYRLQRPGDLKELMEGKDVFVEFDAAATVTTRG